MEFVDDWLCDGGFCSNGADGILPLPVIKGYSNFVHFCGFQMWHMAYKIV